MAAFLQLYNTELSYEGIEQIVRLLHKIDVTEVPGTDDLHHPEEMILKSQQMLSEIYGTKSSYYMVNGSTGGILTAIGAVAAYQKSAHKNQIVIARNCHKSVYNGAELFGLTPIFVEPDYVAVADEDGDLYDESFGDRSCIYGDIKPQQIKSIIRSNPHVAAVIITSPTYEGILTDVEEIKKVLEPYNIMLIVDEAHGAHLPYIDELPRTAIECGADIVVQSLHKTLPSMTQTAILHVNNSELDEGVRKYLSVFMSSSPSYVMLCSMEQAIVAAWENRKHGYGEYIENLVAFRQKVGQLKHIRLLGKESMKGEKSEKNYLDISDIFDYDITRIVLYSNQTGESLAEKLKAYGNIEVEMSGANYVVLISTFMDTKESFEHLYNTLEKLDNCLGTGSMDMPWECKAEINKFSKDELYKLVGTVASDNIYVYPPGSYIIAAGERITREAIDKIMKLKLSGKKIVGKMGD